MEKALVFSQEQKSLIWSRFVGPNEGTQEEARHFVEVCETFGLNPLLGDIVFQKYETKQGTRTNFITTRDGLLRIAAQHPDYVGAPCAAEVREGDEFEFIPSEGTVRHVFGQKRGNIIGAYAVLYHKRLRPCAVFVNFAEYFKANARSERDGGKGGSSIWDAMPSTAIIKVAEVLVLKRQFPLGGLYTAEEMGLEEFKSEQADIIPDHQKSSKNNTPDSSQPVHYQEAEENLPSDEESKSSSTEESQLTSAEESDSKGFVLKHYDSGVSPSGIPYAKLYVVDQESKKEKLVLAKGEESLELTRQIPEEETFLMDVREENGYLFLESVNHMEAGAIS
ncbi:recombinase RecT [Domibacillus indicus]|uniref:RecT family recombinase n=1 Tax=Domibacillus indicus TaxID=1437523 RepID=UPI00203F2476|nr:RecT family recombinase [Domibacillus indicus]MCM3790349.1 recombinase RecT [Domibacillus indicus]